MVKGKKILIGVTGGIAAYKIPFLVRECRKLGGDVKVVMTESATEFVTPLTLSTLSGHDVVVGTFPDSSAKGAHKGTWHIDLAQWADVAVIAPATANVLAKLAGGLADDAVSTLHLALTCPIILSPAMDADMWLHPTTQKNIGTLREMGYRIIPPEEGELASGLSGEGRLPETATIIRAIDETLQRSQRDLHGRRIVVTAGPTFEPIDPVRYIGNRSSGKMGFAIATAAAHRGARVTLITGRVALATPRNVTRVDIETAADMYAAVMKLRQSTDAIIMAAAVADFRPRRVAPRKIKKESAAGTTLSLDLERTTDILAELGAAKKRPLLVGFALETDNGVAHAREKLRKKQLDIIVLNMANTKDAGFDADTNIVTVLSKSGKPQRLPRLPKYDVANEILDRIAGRMK